MLHMWMDRHPSEQNCPYVSNLMLTVCQKQTHLKLLCSTDKPCHWMSSHLTHFLSAKDLCAGWRNIASEYTMDRIHNGQLIPTLSKGRKKKRHKLHLWRDEVIMKSSDVWKKLLKNWSLKLRSEIRSESYQVNWGSMATHLCHRSHFLRKDKLNSVTQCLFCNTWRLRY